MTTYLSPHFALEELTITSHRNLDNTPNEAVRAALGDTAQRMEAVRTALGNKVISINSGYRSPAVNLAVGGVSDSAHLTGHAVDFNCYGFGDPLGVCRELQTAGIKFDQLIQEGTWVHISFAPAMRQMVLTKAGNGYAGGLAG